MKLFQCPQCQYRLYFENAFCLNCSSIVTYDPEQSAFVRADDAGVFQCANSSQCGCNWRTSSSNGFCQACALTKVIPDLSIEGNRARWIRVEAAKKRAVYSLIFFGLPFSPKTGIADRGGLAFDFLGDSAYCGKGFERILTGHDNGLITLNVAEADSAEREKRRIELGESYRTLLGHFRHELGHYYWDQLVRDDPQRHAAFQAIFGDESTDYERALQVYYAEGAPTNWQQRYISAYSASHPWEDWAETWAHYMHITDTLEMVDALQLSLARLEAGDQAGMTPMAGHGVPATTLRWTVSPNGFDAVLERWTLLCEASNSINRCMGLPDLYPFVISESAAEKLTFIHDLLVSSSGQRAASI
jgi:hypothetical protein